MSKSFDSVWDKWQDVNIEEQIISHRSARNKYIGVISKYLSRGSGAKALEVGCGTAIDSYIVSTETGMEIYGVDISEDALKIAEKVEERFSCKVRLSRGDAMSLGYHDEMFDLVFSQGVIEHLVRDVRALKEQVRVLKTGGVLILNVPQKYTAYTMHKHLMSHIGRWEWGHETEFSSRQLARYGKYLGLDILERFGYDYWRSPFELIFVLRTLNHKIGKIPLLRKSPGYGKVSEFWDAMWERLEDKSGHFFMKNLVYVYRKSANESI
ncbi:methyltransferase domain-containing protein [bacterium]|nr:methyltransferase domain-containing protein [bacterium]